MERTACLIFNPVAGQGDSEQDLATIKACLEPEITLGDSIYQQRS